MYTIFTTGGPIHVTSASEAIAAYRREVDAGAHPSVWRGTRLVVHVTQCQACAAPMLMTHAEVSDWVDAYGELEAGVVCPRCRDPRYARYDRDPAWHRHLARMYRHGSNPA